MINIWKVRVASIGKPVTNCNSVQRDRVVRVLGLHCESPGFKSLSGRKLELVSIATGLATWIS